MLLCASEDEWTVCKKIERTETTTTMRCSDFKVRLPNCVCLGLLFYEGWSPSVRIIGSFDQNTYSVIIDNRILPFIYDIRGGPGTFILQEDNCGPHRAKSILATCVMKK